MSEVSPNNLVRYGSRAALAFALLIAAFAALFVSVAPAVDAPARPTSGNIAAAREVWNQVQAAQNAKAEGRVRLDNEAIEGLAALASDATGRARFEAGISRGVLSGTASYPLPAGLWINASASTAGEHSGFPAFYLKVGRVRFPLVVSRWVADMARQQLRRKGVMLPPLDDMIRHLAVDQREVVADLILPEGSGMVHGLISTGATPLDQSLVSGIFCRVAAEQEKARVTDLHQLVGRTFDPAHARGGEDFNRAAFVALSLLVVGEKAEALAPRAVELSKKCPHPGPGFLLHQREDLAKHWTFSAALTAVLGEETAASLGEWKELDDSLPNGTGFSFVDLAADRSGMQTALRALDPDRTVGTTTKLGLATEEDLLPRALLQVPEGMSEGAFLDRFGALDREKYRSAVASIDRTLAQQRSPNAGGS